MNNHKKLRIEALDSATKYLNNLIWDKTIKEYLKNIFPEHSDNIIVKNMIYIEYSDHILLDIFLFSEDKPEKMIKIGELELSEIIMNNKIISIVPKINLFLVPILLNLNIEMERKEITKLDSKNTFKEIDLPGKSKHN